MISKTAFNCTSDIFCHVSADSEFFTTHIALTSQIFAISVLIFTCFLGNCLLCFVVYRSAVRRTAASILLLNLAIADLLIGCLVLPMWILATGELSWPLSDDMCEFVAFMTVVLMLCSVFSLCAIAVDRYCCIAMPLRYPAEVTIQRITLIIAAMWIYCILVASCPLFGWGDYRFQPQTVPICNPVWVTEISFAVFLVLSGMALPVSLMLFSYIKIVLIARDHIRRIDTIQRQLEHPSKQSGDNSYVGDSLPTNQSKFSKSLKMVQRVFIAVGVFFLCWGPYVILNFWSVNNEEIPVPYVADLLVTLLAFANSSINPVIFIVLNKDFRHTLRALRSRIQGKTPCFKDRALQLDESSDPIYQVVSPYANNEHREVSPNGALGISKAPLETQHEPINSSNQNLNTFSTDKEIYKSNEEQCDSEKELSERPSSRLSRTRSFRKLPKITDQAVPGSGKNAGKTTSCKMKIPSERKSLAYQYSRELNAKALQAHTKYISPSCKLFDRASCLSRNNSFSTTRLEILTSVEET